MARYTYRTVELSAYNIDVVAEQALKDTLTEAGNKGFELVSVITFTNNAGAVMQRLYFKKEE